MPSTYKLEPGRRQTSQKQAPQAANSSGSVPRHLEQLIAIEAAARDAETLTELQYVIANESLKLLPVRQVIVFRGEPGKAGWKIDKISSITDPDRNAPLVRWLLKAITLEIEKQPENVPTRFVLPATENTVLYPFAKGVFFPVRNRQKKVLGGFCLLSEEPIEHSTVELASHLLRTFSHAWAALAPQRDWISRIATRRNGLIGAAIIAALLCFPVPLTVLAPVEIVARDPAIIAAPLQGVVEEILVKPNAAVNQGDVLFRFNKLEHSNRLAVTDRELEVARAKFQRSTQTAFLNYQGRKELAVTKAEFEVAKAQQEFARAQLERTDVTAPADGVVIFSSIDDWEGRPVSIGERVMRLADPARTAVKISLPVSDAALLEQDMAARIFLDANPISPYRATITRKSYSAVRQEAGELAFPVYAQLNDSAADTRIGWRGTAQLSGNYVPLAYNLFRRPLSAIRQYLGL